MNSALIETAPVGGDGPALGAGARGGVDGLELELAAAVKDDDEVDEAAEAGEPGADAMLGIDGSVGDEKGGGEADAAAQGVLIDRRGGVWGGVAAVAHGVRTAVASGCKTIVLTNGCGGLREGMRPGQPVLISDHINLTAASPIVGPNFVDLTDLYSPRLRALCKEVDPGLEEGVYVQFPGPHYETPAEINMVRVLGGDLVGMSTVLEAIAAREAGAEVLGISLVTNLAAGLSGEPLNHEEVLQAGRDSATQMGALLARVLERI